LDYRTPAQTDRDRVQYSSAFARLAEVTQVVSADRGYVFHNRLTHSLKVAQLARRISEKLRGTHKNEADALQAPDPDIAEAAALAHDLGHPPFGHTAENELDRLARKAGLEDGFEGNAQSFRIVSKLAVSDAVTADSDKTPVTLSVAAGLTLWNFYFRIYAGAIKKEQIVDFLAALVGHLGQPLLIVWDRLSSTDRCNTI
jgi:predicted deoxyguanosinetriphosphate triphosphohydrolase